LVDIEIMLKSVSLCLEAGMMLHVHESCSQHGRRDHRLKENGANWADNHWISVMKYLVLPSFVFIDK
jgi:hypothetical protein